MNFTYFYLLFLAGSTGYRIRRIIKSYSHEPSPGRVSFPPTYAILLFLYLAVWVGAIFEYFYFTYILQVKEINLAVSLIGITMYVGVIPLRKWALNALGKQLSADIKIAEDHRLIKEGPYQYVRHPLIICVVAEVFALALIPNSYYSFLIALFGFMPFMVFRAHLEEKALTEEFGEEYLNYKKEAYGFLPLKKVKKDEG
ncbi:isoprenylcysteine carboxylmethyltransferase family protein [bacterium]|nr:isoprenylcysteine carboxylmethyltransferase family protein [bacterium]